jgi:hypothetical protein
MDSKDVQKLIDICYQLVLTSTSHEDFCKWSDESKAEWVSKTLKECGFDTTPCGSSWGVLKENNKKHNLFEDANGNEVR